MQVRFLQFKLPFSQKWWPKLFWMYAFCIVKCRLGEFMDPYYLKEEAE